MNLQIGRAQGCPLGQLAVDALGSLVEFQPPEQIGRDYANGVRELTYGGTWKTIAGQPTDDPEMALLLAPACWWVGAHTTYRPPGKPMFIGSAPDPSTAEWTILAGLRGRLVALFQPIDNRISCT